MQKSKNREARPEDREREARREHPEEAEQRRMQCRMIRYGGGGTLLVTDLDTIASSMQSNGNSCNRSITALSLQSTECVLQSTKLVVLIRQR